MEDRTNTRKKYRQGDVLLVPVEKQPEAFFKKREDGVVAYGEVTGHTHRIINGTVADLFEHGLYVNVDSGGKIVHDEHNAIDLDKGLYKVVIQREYTAGDVRRVVD